MNLLDDQTLERSAVVANCRMNRERALAGSNGYGVELGLDPIGFLADRAAAGRRVAWLDLCCGTGRAPIEAARIARDGGIGHQVEIVGVDLVGMFLQPDPGPGGPTLVEASLTTWRPRIRFDLITCVHGLHYVGDKLGLIARSASWLADDGLFLANLALENIKFPASHPPRKLATELRRAGLEFDPRRHLLSCRGRKDLRWPFRYLGADDRAGPNYTGQPAVNSHYEVGPAHRSPGRS